VCTHDVGNRRAPLCWTLAFVLSRTGCWLQNYEATVGDGAYMHTRRVGVTVLATIDGYIIRLVCSNPALVGAPTTPGDAEQCVLQVRDAHISYKGGYATAYRANMRRPLQRGDGHYIIGSTRS
jgi:hypothetical protein